MLVNIRCRQLTFNSDEGFLAKLWPSLAKAGFDGAVYHARTSLAQQLNIDLTTKKGAELFIPRVQAHGFVDGDLFKISDKGALYLIVKAVEPVENKDKTISEDAVFEEPGFADVPDYSLDLEVGEIALFGEETGARFENFCEAIEKQIKSGTFEDVLHAGLKEIASMGQADIEPPSEDDLEVANVLRDSDRKSVV